MDQPHTRKPLFRLLIIVGSSLLSLFFLIGIGLACFEYWWRGTPQYSLQQIATAMETHDIQLFRKHVDVRSVSSRLIDDLAKIQTTPQRAGDALGLALVGLMKPQILELWESQIERFVETGQFEAKEKDPDNSLRTLHKDIANRIRPITFVSREGNVALIQLRVEPRNAKEKPTVLDLKMRRTNEGYWQLMEVSLPCPL